VVAALGTPALAVLIFEVLLNATSMFNHGNVRIPARIDQALRWLVVTPDMHRVHHSSAPGESRANLSTTFSWWDRLFGTYVDQPAAGHANVAFGIHGFEDRKHLTLPWMLAQPFLPEPDSAAPEASESRIPNPSSLI
jgi:sterol desaturase/sphingolipid hydroxylase (fatty acid hydroxylase superfamily)